MSQQPTIKTESKGAPFGSLQEFLPFYKEYLAKHFNAVTSGEDMLQLGAKTALIQELEAFVASPIDTMTASHTSMGKAIQSLIERFFLIYFKTAKENNLVKTVFRLPSDQTLLSYGIVLTEDTFTSRELVLDFLNAYCGFKFAEIVPAQFQFIPEKSVSAFENIIPVV